MQADASLVGPKRSRMSAGVGPGGGGMTCNEEEGRAAGPRQEAAACKGGEAVAGGWVAPACRAPAGVRRAGKGGEWAGAGSSLCSGISAVDALQRAQGNSSQVCSAGLGPGNRLGAGSGVHGPQGKPQSFRGVTWDKVKQVNDPHMSLLMVRKSASAA